MKIIILGIIGLFIGVNIMMCFFALGYVLQEKYPNRKSVFDILCDFWKKIWRLVL